MHIVREIKKYHRHDVEKAIFRIGYFWRDPKKDTPRSIDKMVAGLARCELEQILGKLQEMNRQGKTTGIHYNK